MNYKKIYDKIIENRLNNPLDETEYGENHHIIPRSLGGSDEVQNLVRLTAREHFICHALLAEMYDTETFEWYKMNHAFMMMKASSDDHNGNRYFNSRLYELKRKDFSKVMSEVQSGKKNSQYGKVWIHNVELEKSIKVYKSELDSYLDSGWVKGRVLDFEKFKKVKLTKYDIDCIKYKTLNGIVVNKHRINKIKSIFNIDLEENFTYKFEELTSLLYTLYVTEELSPQQIAVRFNTNRNTISSNLELCDIKLRNIDSARIVMDTDTKLVEQYDKFGNLLKVWKTATEASVTLKIKRKYIVKCCNDTQNTFKGYIWKYRN
jgi:hypothetical protein